MENAEEVIPRLNEELLKKPRVAEEQPKRNTKDALIDRILLMAEENNLEIMVSNTKLKRMSKPALQKLLGEMLNECMKKQIAETVKAPGTDDSVIAFATLRMMHDMCVMGVEKGLNNYLPKYGYNVHGFHDSMKKPMVSKCVDQCLKEIAAESDVLQYIESPYARLGIAWTTALFTCIQRAPPPQNYNVRYNNKYGTPRMEPRPNPTQNPVRTRVDRGTETGEVDRNGGPPVKTV